MGFYYRTYTRLGKQTLGGHKQNLVCTRTQEKGAVTPQETDPDLPVSVQETLAEVWVREGLGSACMGPFEGGCHIFIASTVVWSQVKQQSVNTTLPINRKLD